MITVTTPCDECIHSSVCKYRDKASTMRDKLSRTIYDPNPSSGSDYQWDKISLNNHVDIEFRCTDFSLQK